jgi:hypothetical protein
MFRLFLSMVGLATIVGGVISTAFAIYVVTRPAEPLGAILVYSQGTFFAALATALFVGGTAFVRMAASQESVEE